MTEELSITELARRDEAQKRAAALANPIEFDCRGGTSVRNEIAPSDSVGCHSSQSAEFTNRARQAGFTNVHYDDKGRCHMPKFGKQRKQYLKFRGLTDFGAV